MCMTKEETWFLKYWEIHLSIESLLCNTRQNSIPGSYHHSPPSPPPSPLSSLLIHLNILDIPLLQLKLKFVLITCAADI